MKKKVLIVDNTACSGCMSCAINCSQFHEGSVCIDSSRLRIELEPFTGVHRIIYCRQCEDAECAANCPTGAINFDEENNCYIVDYEVCIGCQTCVDSCPYGAMFYDPNNENVIKCDLCGGEPNCVASCFTKALWYGVEGEDLPDKLSSRYFHAESLKNKEENDG